MYEIQYQIVGVLEKSEINREENYEKSNSRTFSRDEEYDFWVKGATICLAQ